MTAAQIALQALTAALAIYGAGLSTYNAIQARRKDSRSLQVRMNTSMFTFGSSVGPPMLTIEVVNDGHRSVVADPPQLIMTEMPGKVMALMGAQGLNEFPKQLAEGEVGCVRIAYGDVARSLISAGCASTVELRAICKDSTGRQYRSSSWKVDVAEWLRMDAA